MSRDLAAELSAELKAALEPLLAEVESLNQAIAEYDQRIEQIATEVHPEVALLKQVKGVGTLIALTYVLTLDERPTGTERKIAPTRARKEGWRQRRIGSNARNHRKEEQKQS